MSATDLGICHVEPRRVSAVVGRTASLASVYGYPRTLRSAGASKPMWEGLAQLMDSIASSGSGPTRSLVA